MLGGRAWIGWRVALGLIEVLGPQAARSLGHKGGMTDEEGVSWRGVRGERRRGGWERLVGLGCQG